MNTTFNTNKLKRQITILLVFGLLSLQAQAQLISVIDNKGTISNVRNNQVTTAATAPTTPLEGDVWFETDTLISRVWDGTSWVRINTWLGYKTIHHNITGVLTITDALHNNTDIHLESTGNLTITNTNVSDGSNFYITNTTNVNRALSFTGFTGAYLRNGGTATNVATGLSLKANTRYLVHITENGGNFYFNATEAGAGAGGGETDQIIDADGDTLVQVEESADEDKIRFDTAGTERVIITETGNVGIGTNDPLGLVHLRSGATHVPLIIETNDIRAGIELETQTSTNAGQGIFNVGVNTGRGITNYGTTDQYDAGFFRIDTRSTQRNFSWNWRDSSSATTNSLMTLTRTGNLGIGTATPAQRLSVIAATDPAIIVGTSTGGEGALYFGNTGHGVKRNYNNLGNDVGLYTSAADLHLSANGENTGQFVLRNNGNVGIGTSTPNAPLQLASTTANRKVVLYEATDNNHEFYGFGINSGVQRYQVANPAADHVFYTAVNATSSNELVRIKGTGNVGIAASNPQADLHIGSSSTSASDPGEMILSRYWNNANDVRASAIFHYIESGGAGDGLGFASSGDVGHRNAPNQLSEADMVIRSNGRVGIGTTTPDHELDVRGNVRIGNGTSGEQDIQFISSAVNMQVGVNDFVNGFYVFGGSYRFTVNQTTGNVGIGTTTPSQRLHVIGNILASGTITPDYVFEKYYEGESSLKSDYTMQTLSEIEAFTREHKHLPGVPSAQDVEEKGGIVLNRATEINLEKIEELYLHTIEQQKQIEILQTQVKLLLESKE